MSATTTTRTIPTAAEAKVSVLASAVRKAAAASARDGRPYYVVPTYTRVCIERDAPKFGSYWAVHEDHADRIEGR